MVGWVNALRSHVPAPPSLETPKKARSSSLLLRRSSLLPSAGARPRDKNPKPTVARLPPVRSIACKLSDASVSVAEVYDVGEVLTFAIEVTTPRHVLKTSRTLEQTVAFVNSVKELRGGDGNDDVKGAGDTMNTTDTGEGLLYDLRIKASMASQIGALGAPDRGSTVEAFLRECVGCGLKIVAEEVYQYFGVKFQGSERDDDNGEEDPPAETATTMTTTEDRLGSWTEEYAILHGAVTSLGNSVSRLQESYLSELAEARMELDALKAAHDAFAREVSAVTLTTSNPAVIESVMTRRLEKALVDRNEAVVQLALFKAEEAHAVELTQRRRPAEVQRQQSGGGSFEEDDAPFTNTFTEDDMSGVLKQLQREILERTRTSMQLKSAKEMADAEQVCRLEERRLKERELKEALELAERERTRGIALQSELIMLKAALREGGEVGERQK